MQGRSAKLLCMYIYIYIQDYACLLVCMYVSICACMDWLSMCRWSNVRIASAAPAHMWACKHVCVYMCGPSEISAIGLATKAISAHARTYASVYIFIYTSYLVQQSSICSQRYFHSRQLRRRLFRSDQSTLHMVLDTQCRGSRSVAMPVKICVCVCTCIDVCAGEAVLAPCYTPRQSKMCDWVCVYVYRCVCRGSRSECCRSDLASQNVPVCVLCVHVLCT